MVPSYGALTGTPWIHIPVIYSIQLKCPPTHQNPFKEGKGPVKRVGDHIKGP